MLDSGDIGSNHDQDWAKAPDLRFSIMFSQLPTTWEKGGATRACEQN